MKFHCATKDLGSEGTWGFWEPLTILVTAQDVRTICTKTTYSRGQIFIPRETWHALDLESNLYHALILGWAW